jgi:predicted aconitase
MAQARGGAPGGGGPRAAPTLDAVLPDRDLDTVEVTLADLRAARDELSGAAPAPIDAVNLGTPHFSVDEFARLAALLRGGCRFDPDVDVYVSTSRAVLDEATAAGHVGACEAAGARIVVDTCTYVTTVLSPTVAHAMTNSAKWAWYAPSNVGVQVTLGTLAECVASARSGEVVRDDAAWG